MPHKVPQNPAARSAAVSSLSTKNLRGGGYTNPPPIRARVKHEDNCFKASLSSSRIGLYPCAHLITLSSEHHLVVTEPGAAEHLVVAVHRDQPLPHHTVAEQVFGGVLPHQRARIEPLQAALLRGVVVHEATRGGVVALLRVGALLLIVTVRVVDELLRLAAAAPIVRFEHAHVVRTGVGLANAGGRRAAAHHRPAMHSGHRTATAWAKATGAGVGTGAGAGARLVLGLVLGIALGLGLALRLALGLLELSQILYQLISDQARVTPRRIFRARQGQLLRSQTAKKKNNRSVTATDFDSCRL